MENTQLGVLKSTKKKKKSRGKVNVNARYASMDPNTHTLWWSSP
jgi:hypothetical protein